MSRQKSARLEQSEEACMEQIEELKAQLEFPDHPAKKEFAVSEEEKPILLKLIELEKYYVIIHLEKVAREMVKFEPGSDNHIPRGYVYLTYANGQFIWLADNDDFINEHSPGETTMLEYLFAKEWMQLCNNGTQVGEIPVDRTRAQYQDLFLIFSKYADKSEDPYPGFTSKTYYDIIVEEIIGV
jgi:hypothetical protein